MWGAWHELTPRARAAWVIGGLIILLALVNGSNSDQPNSVASSAPVADPRYVKAVEREGYKGSEAENIAVAAERLCRNTGGTDC